MTYNWVKNYIGIPFASGGRTREGCDCYGLVRLVLGEVYGVNLPELSDGYNNALCIAETSRLFEEQLPVLSAEKIPEPEEGAVIVIRHEGRPCHLGIYAGGGYVLDCNYKTGCACRRLSHAGLRGRIEGYYRVR
jgi:cell wall-associated NlpC family hydrolase